MTVSAPPIQSHWRGVFCQALFETWSRQDVDFVVLRNYERLPHAVSNDIDVLITPGSLRKAEALLVECAERCGLQLCNRAEFQPLSLFFVHADSAEPIHVDLFHSLTWRGFRLLSAEEVLALKRPCDSFWIPHPVHEAIVNLLNHLLYRGSVRDKYKTQITEVLTAAPAFGLACLSEIFGMEPARQLVGWIASSDWHAIEGHAGRLRLLVLLRRLAFAPGETVRHLLADAWRLAKRFAHPPGLAIALLGPDGAGKSTVAEGLPSSLTGVLSTPKARYVHWKPRFNPVRGEGAPTTNPYADDPRPAPLSFLFLGAHIVQFWIGWVLLVRPRLFANGLVVLDRYYFDIVLDPRRYRLSLPRMLLTTSLRLVPRPDLVVYLDAATSVLRFRKQELPVPDLDRIRSRLYQVSSVLNSPAIVDASGPVPEVTSKVQTLAIAFLTQRARRRRVRL